MLCPKEIPELLVTKEVQGNNENDKDRLRLLQLMVHHLKERSHVQRTYVSVSCNSKGPISTRDMPRPNLIDHIQGIEGTMQDLLIYLKASEKDLHLVTLDFASTDADDIRDLVSKCPKIKKIIIDQFGLTRESLFSTETISSHIQSFNCRLCLAKILAHFMD
ncbi:hypothetical protein VTP01DRAFT_3013 [Rhizomucor pusillus]|uniref:uncharacterized protein n=1 Tax=Rhizomucor pusillus TaxID=4840 RepID=UPI003743DEBE